MSVLAPFTHALAAVLAATHSILTALGADPSAGSTWMLCIAAVVVVVRLALLPLVVHGVRQTHAAARARPALRALTAKYRGRNDLDSLRALRAERRQIAAEHRLSRWGALATLAQVPVWLALYDVLRSVAGGVPLGAVGAALVASLGAATVLGVPLVQRGYLGGGAAHLLLAAGLALTAATLAYLTQRFFVAPNTVLSDLPDAIARAHQFMPALSALGMLLAGCVAPLALLVYWVCNSTWTLAQSAIACRWFPTPGSPAAAG